MKSPIKKILVTGGAGFIGSYFIRQIYTKYPEYEIINLDILTYAGNRDNLVQIEKVESKKKLAEKRYYFLQGDICDPAFVKRAFRKYKPDVVINFAAESHVDRSIKDSRYFFRTNLIGVHNLVDQVVACHIPRFVQISTDEVYGDILQGESTEESKFAPSNPYAASKASADLLVQSYMRTHKLPAIILRGSNNYGPYQYPEKLIPLAITNMLEKKKVPIHGTGMQERRWLHVEDFCTAIDISMHEASDFSIYNVSGAAMRTIDIIRAISHTIGKDSGNVITYINDRPGGDMRYAPNASKIMRELMWKPRFHVRQDIVGVVEWYRENKSWWEKIKKKKEFSIRYNKQYKSEF